MIRNNRDIKGIKINGEEYKISQYADDTSLFTDGSPQSLDGILQTLDFFACISGLKINFDKTKIIWIGSKKFSMEVFHHSRWKFDSVHTKFDLLRVKFLINLDDMIHINYKYVMEKIEKILISWKFRNLTPIGRITVIKTLVIPKLNHLILTIPNPSVEFIIAFERKLFNFVWNNKPDKIKRNSVVQDYKNGGLKMIDFKNFMIALKSSWIRRLIFSQSNWIKLFESQFGYSLQTIISLGIDFIDILIKKSTNTFWTDVLLSWKTIFEASKDTGSYKEMFYEHLWFNPEIKIDKKSVLYKDLLEQGVRYIADIYENSNELLSYTELKNRINTKINYIQYIGLTKAVQHYLKQNDKQLLKNYDTKYPNTIEIFCRSKKGCRDMYNTLILKKKAYPTSETKWNKEIEVTRHDWSKIYSLPFKCTKESKLHWFQFQLLHRILPTNNYLHKIGQANSPLCYLCQQTIETIEHIFAECFVVKEIWIEVEKWISGVFNIQTSFDKYSILFGKYENSTIHRLENLIILFTKQYVFQTKMRSSRPNAMVLKNVLTKRLYIEQFLLLKNCNYLDYNNYWKVLFQNLESSSPTNPNP